MPRLDEIISREVRERSRTTRAGKQYKGIIASDAADNLDEVTVIVRDFSSRHRHGPCRFPMSNGETLPSRGDPCLVAFDEDEDPWILVWYVEA